MVLALTLALAAIAPSQPHSLATDYTPISELTVERSADGKSLSGKIVLGQNWNASQGWGRHGQPWPFFVADDNATLFLNNPWSSAGLAATFTASGGSDVVAYTVKRAEGTFPQRGWLMFVLEGHEYGRGDHSQQQFFAAWYREPISDQGPQGSSPPPGGSVLPITLHRPIDSQSASRKIMNWGGTDNVADAYTFAYKGSPTPGPHWTQFDPMPSRFGPRQIAFDEPVHQSYAAEARQRSTYSTLGGTWPTAAGVIRTKTSRLQG